MVCIWLITYTMIETQVLYLKCNFEVTMLELLFYILITNIALLPKMCFSMNRFLFTTRFKKQTNKQTKTTKKNTDSDHYRNVENWT